MYGIGVWQIPWSYAQGGTPGNPVTVAASLTAQASINADANAAPSGVVSTLWPLRNLIGYQSAPVIGNPVFLDAALQAAVSMVSDLRIAYSMSASLSGNAVQVGQLQAVYSASALLSAVASLQDALSHSILLDSVLGGVVTLTASASKSFSASAQLQAFAQLAASAQRIAQLEALLQSQGLLVASLYRTSDMAAVLQAVAGLQGSSGQFYSIDASVSGVANLIANAGLRKSLNTMLAAMALVSGALVTLRGQIDPEKVTGRLYFEVLSGGIVVGAGPIQRVFDSSIEHKLDSAGRWMLTMAIADEYYALLQHGREIHIYREGEGIIGKGFVGMKEESSDSNS